jgi:hypothetical protein
VTVADDILARLGSSAGQVAVEPPGDGDGFWAGGPSAVYHDGSHWLAYRLRRPVDQGRGYANIVARARDGVRFTPVATVTAAQFGAASLERPALVPLPGGGWRLYVSCSSAGSKHWWVEAIEAEDVAQLASGSRTVVLPGDPATAWKDVVVHASAEGWQMWACRHRLDGGDEEADRMTSWYFTGSDGLSWSDGVAALYPTPGSWDARGARITSVLAVDAAWAAFYDGRASAAENWFERTGLAAGETPGSFTAVAGPTAAGSTLRYLSVVGVPQGYRCYWEASRPDGANELRTDFLAV